MDKYGYVDVFNANFLHKFEYSRVPMTPYDSLIVPVRTGKEDLLSSELRREARIKRGKESLVEVEYFQEARQRAECEEQL